MPSTAVSQDVRHKGKILVVDDDRLVLATLTHGLSEAGYDVIDAAGKFVTPGLIDAHSHLGVYPSPAVPAHSDGNELTDPNTAGVWAEHSVWPQDPGFNLARAEIGRAHV